MDTALGSGLGQATLGLLDPIPCSSDLSGVVLKGLHWLGGEQQQGRLEGHRPVRGPYGRGRADGPPLTPALPMVSPGVTQTWTSGPTVQDTKAQREA